MGRAGWVVLFDPPGCCDMLIHPDFRGGALEEDQLAWAEQQARLYCGRAAVAARITVGSLDGDAGRLAMLARRGYARQPSGAVHLRRPLEGPIADPVLPSGFVCRGLAGEVELEERVALHRMVFPASRLTVESYRRLMQRGVYDASLDVVAIDYEGRMAAFCLGWLDGASGAGLIEPMGVHPQYRRRGLGRAIVLEVLHRLQHRAARLAALAPVSGNGLAIALYESCGLRAVLTDQDYALDLVERG